MAPENKEHLRWMIGKEVSGIKFPHLKEGAEYVCDVGDGLGRLIAKVIITKNCKNPWAEVQIVEIKRNNDIIPYKIRNEIMVYEGQLFELVYY